MTIRALGYVLFKTHQVYISKDDVTAYIHCFKATNDRCDMQIFTNEDAASDYILAPFNDIVYSLVIAGEDQSE
jgi:hypothetical protein